MYKQIFLSHAWGKDSNNRDNHLRCKELKDKLLLYGYNVWFDDNDMYGNIDSAIINGINNCKVVLLCLTERYNNKINNAVKTNNFNDSCYKEFNYSVFKNKIIIPVIMDNKMKELYFTGDGLIQMYFNSTLYIDMSENINNDFELLCKSLKKYNVYTKDEQKKYNIVENSKSNNMNLFLNNSITRVIEKKNRTNNNINTLNSCLLLNLNKNNKSNKSNKSNKNIQEVIKI